LVDTDRKADTVSTMDEGKRQKRPRRSFTEDFKAGAVRLVLDEGKTIPQVARDLDLTQSALRTWVERARADRTKGKTGLTSEERAELARLRKEVRELRMEREILKKAAVRSTGRRNGRDLLSLVGGCPYGAARSARFVGAAEEGTVVPVEAGSVAQ
jgi:transposase